MKSRDAKIHALIQAITLIQNADEGLRFFTDLCTPAELEAMADRWQVVPLLQAKVPYRTIHEQTGVSVATITRIARCIQFGSGGYTLIAERVDVSPSVKNCGE
ncbi:MAG: transposase [Legionellaceae bacterium]|nr:transposase [Legionellaceae bacterium]MBP9774586.1 transposase [Legionellaceae bacterium]